MCDSLLSYRALPLALPHHDGPRVRFLSRALRRDLFSVFTTMTPCRRDRVSMLTDAQGYDVMDNSHANNVSMPL